MNASTLRRAWWLWALLGVLLCAVIAVAVATLSDRTAEATPEPTRMWFDAGPGKVVTGESLRVWGGLQITDSLAGQTVAIATRQMDQDSDTLVAQVPLRSMGWGNIFDARVSGMRYNGIVTASWVGDGDHLPASSWCYVGVRAKVRLRALHIGHGSLKLRATITPAQPQDAPAFLTAKSWLGLVLFQRQVKGRWQLLSGMSTLDSDLHSRVTVSFSGLKPGRYLLRARFAGTKYNLAAVSKTLRITVP